MNDPRLTRLHTAIRDVTDFPKPGIVFKDITPVLADGKLFQDAIDIITEAVAPMRPDKLVGIDARGFIFAAAVAYKLGIGLIIVRKKGKLPWRTEAASYSLEYGEATVEIHADAISPNERIVLVDDLLATGGTSSAALQLVHRLRGAAAGAVFLIELGFLNGRQALPGIEIRTVLPF